MEIQDDGRLIARTDNLRNGTDILATLSVSIPHFEPRRNRIKGALGRVDPSDLKKEIHRHYAYWKTRSLMLSKRVLFDMGRQVLAGGNYVKAMAALVSLLCGLNAGEAMPTME